MTKVIENKRHSKIIDIMQVAINYIKNNYNKDIGVVQIADACHITPNYLSHIFKQENGKKILFMAQI